MPAPILAALALALGTRGLLQWQDQSNADQASASYTNFVNSLFAPTNFSEQGPTQPTAPNQNQILQGLLADPRTAHIGAQLMLQQQAGANQLQNTGLIGQQQMQNTSLVGQQRMAEQQVQDQSAMQRLQYEIAARERMARQMGPEIAKPQPGFMRVPGPSGVPMDLIIPGSEPHLEALDLISTNQRAIDRLQEQIALIDQYGGTPIGTHPAEISGRMHENYGQIVADVAKMRSPNGVGREGILRMIMESLTDPTAKSSVLSRPARTRAQYAALLDEQKLKALELRQKYIGPAFPANPINPCALPSGAIPFTP